MTKKYQEELDHISADTHGRTEYQKNFIRNPQFGPYKSDEMFDLFDCLEFFNPKFIAKSIKEFQNLTIKRKLPQKDYENIEKGISAYTGSSTVPQADTALLYKSLIKKEPSILLNKLEQSEKYVRQLIQENYFETFERFDLFSFNNKDLIAENSLQIYKDCAEEITLKRLKEWVEYSKSKNEEDACLEDFDSIFIYRGVNNRLYYDKNNHKKNKEDFLSLYKSLDDDFPFFEKNLLTSYTLSQSLAEQFMLGNPKKKSKRRVFVQGHTEIIKERIFTSFLVSEHFKDAQFEIICLPDKEKLKIRTDFDNEIHANYTIYE